MSMPWFRLYHEFITDPIVQSLSFEDQRHYIGILCLKASGVLDRDLPARLRPAIISKGMGITSECASEIQARLMEVDLVAEDWQPTAWDKRQFRERNGVVATPPGGNAKAYVYFIGEVGGSEVKIGYSKNPWARVKEFQTGNVKPLRVLATVATTEDSEVATAKAFRALRISGEWYAASGIIPLVIKEIKDIPIKTEEELINYVANYVASYESTTTDTEAEAEKKTSKKNGVFLPEWIDPKVWRAFKQMRAKQRSPMTDRAETLLIAKLDKMRADNQEPNAVLDQSIESGWKGVYPLKETPAENDWLENLQ